MPQRGRQRTRNKWHLHPLSQQSVCLFSRQLKYKVCGGAMGKVRKKDGGRVGAKQELSYQCLLVLFFFCPALSPKIQYLLCCSHNSPARVSGTSQPRVPGYYFLLLFRPEEHESSVRSLLFSLGPSRLHQLPAGSPDFSNVSVSKTKTTRHS